MEAAFDDRVRDLIGAHHPEHGGELLAQGILQGGLLCLALSGGALLGFKPGLLLVGGLLCLALQLGGALLSGLLCLACGGGSGQGIGLALSGGLPFALLAFGFSGALALLAGLLLGDRLQPDGLQPVGFFPGGLLGAQGFKLSLLGFLLPEDVTLRLQVRCGLCQAVLSGGRKLFHRGGFDGGQLSQPGLGIGGVDRGIGQGGDAVQHGAVSVNAGPLSGLDGVEGQLVGADEPLYSFFKGFGRGIHGTTAF